jgi:hypothetical protein
VASYSAITGVAISDANSINETISDGSTTNETTKLDTIGDESKSSKVPVISLNDFIAFLLK